MTQGIVNYDAQQRLTGEITMFGGSTAPSGWALCDGTAISRTTYASLYAVIGTRFGTGDGSTTFNLPDLRGASPAGAGTSSGYTQNETVALGTKYDDQMQGHIHDVVVPYFPGGSYGAFNVPNAAATYTAANTGFYITSPVTDGVNGTPRTGTFTKGKSVGLNFIIKT